MCWRVEKSFPVDDHLAGAARRFVEGALTDRLAPVSRPPVIDDAVLVVSELVTNGLRAGASSVGVLVRLHRGELEIAVTDDAAGNPQLQRADPRDSHGRGLLIVQAMCAQWGVEAVPVGKRVWAALALPTPVSLAVACVRNGRGLSRPSHSREGCSRHRQRRARVAVGWRAR